MFENTGQVAADAAARAEEEAQATDAMKAVAKSRREDDSFDTAKEDEEMKEENNTPEGVSAKETATSANAGRSTADQIEFLMQQIAMLRAQQSSAPTEQEEIAHNPDEGASAAASDPAIGTPDQPATEVGNQAVEPGGQENGASAGSDHNPG